MYKYPGLISQAADVLAIDAIDLVTDLYHLAGTVVSVVNTIQYRIQQAYGNADYEMAVLLNPARKAYFLNPLPNAPFVCDENFPEDVIFVLCKSVGGQSIIELTDDIDWVEFWLRLMRYANSRGNELPRLAIRAMYLQARIRIIETTA